jgi:hypothetical protein
MGVLQWVASGEALLARLYLEEVALQERTVPEDREANPKPVDKLKLITRPIHLLPILAPHLPPFKLLLGRLPQLAMAIKCLLLRQSQALPIVEEEGQPMH